MKFIPVGSNILVKEVKEEYKTQSGIILNHDSEERKINYHKGVIIKMGKGKVNEDGIHAKIDAKEGDTILFPKYSGDKIKLDEDEYMILPFEKVSAVVTE